MRTTIHVPDELFASLKRRAADEGTSLKKVVERALRALVSERPRATGYRLRWRSENGRLMPGVRIEDRESLFDAMDGRS